MLDGFQGRGDGVSDIQAVIWDFGGVISSSPFESFSRFEVERGLPKDFLRTVNATNPHENAWARLERSEFDTAAFDEAFAQESRALGHEVRGRDVLPLLAGQIRPEMVEALRRIREKMKTIPPEQMSPQAMLAAYEDSDFEKMEEIRARVDSIVSDSQAAQDLKAWYNQLCKRPCFHDTYLQAFNEPSTRLIDTDGKGVERIDETGFWVG
jgi:cation diffusion facilitator CzcD-associated flavoprotein CzcO